jgi:large subunit ribosomal protein L16
MLLQPKNRSFQKSRKKRVKLYCSPHAASWKNAPLQVSLKYGDFGMFASHGGKLSSRQLEAARRALVHSLKKVGRIWLRSFPDHPVTEKPSDVRMGKGKGARSFWVAILRPGQPIFEIQGVSVELAKKSIVYASKKLPIKTFFAQRQKPLSDLPQRGDSAGTSGITQ